MDELRAKSGSIYIIGCLLRPGTLSFATSLEHDYFPPDDDINELYNIFQLQYCNMPYYIVEIPRGSFSVAEKVAQKYKLAMVNGKPSNPAEDDKPFGLVCNAESCYTLETIHDQAHGSWSDQLKEEQANVRQRLKMTQTDIGNE